MRRKCRLRKEAQEQRSRDKAVKKRMGERPGEDGGDDVDVAAENEEEDLEDLSLQGIRDSAEKEKTRTHQKPEGVPALPASPSARAEMRGQRLKLARTADESEQSCRVRASTFLRERQRREVRERQATTLAENLRKRHQRSQEP